MDSNLLQWGRYANNSKWLAHQKDFITSRHSTTDPLSPLLYVLCVEVLACQIRNSPNVKGFLLPSAKGKQFKVRQYADNTTSLVKDFRSLKNLFDIISVYE